MPIAEFATDRLTLLARQKRDCLAQWHALADAQSEAISSGDTTQLLAVLAAKQRLLGALLELEREFDPFRGQPPEGRAWRSESARGECGALLSECETLYREILERERLAEQSLVQSRDRTAAQLQDVRSAEWARRAYATDGPEASSLDLHSNL